MEKGRKNYKENGVFRKLFYFRRSVVADKLASLRRNNMNVFKNMIC